MKGTASMDLPKWTISMWALIAIAVVGITLDAIGGIRGHYAYQNSIEAYWTLADRSSTIPKKAEYVDKFVAALESQHFDGQYNAIVFPTQDNSFDRNFEALKSLQGRLREIEKMDATSFQYQTAIQQITQQEQGEAGQMLQVFEGVWWKNNHFLLWDWVGFVNWALVTFCLPFAFMCGVFASDDEWD